ncbi:MAG: PEP-CTERM system TPR-repeat protein PrsT, partial [bacterium]|nr:PEP-CTERM system TPR-repeat protein PrsT [bacterium]
MCRVCKKLQNSIVTLLVVLSILLLCQSSLADSEGTKTGAAVGKFYEEALQSFSEGEYRVAVIQLKKALQQDSGHLPSRILLGRSYLSSDSPVRAEAEFLQARKLGADRRTVDPLLAESYLQLGKFQPLIEEIEIDLYGSVEAAKLLFFKGKAYLGLNAPDRAMKAFREATRLNPKDAGALLGQAQVHLDKGELVPARKLLADAWSMEPDNPEYWLSKSQLSQREGKPGMAADELTKFLELKPGHANARSGRAALLIELNRLGAAQEDVDILQAGKRIDPFVDYLQAKIHFLRGDSESAKRSLVLAGETIDKIPPEQVEGNRRLLLLAGSVQFAAGNLEKASSYLQKLLRKWPDTSAARKIMIKLLLAQNQPERAEKMLVPLLEQSPPDPLVQLLSGQIYLANKNHAAAARVFEKLASEKPKDAQLQINLAQSLIGTNRIGEAVAALGSVGQRGRQGVTAGIMLTVLNMQQGKIDEAIVAAQRVIELEPENLPAISLLGSAKLMGGDFKGARQAFQHALEIDPNFLTAKLNLGNVDAKEGKPQQARQRYQKMLDQDPSQAEILTAYSNLEASLGNLDEAIRWREKLRSFQPAEIQSNLELAELYLRSGDPRQAHQLLQTLLTNHPDDYRIRLALAVSQIASNEKELAKVTLNDLARDVSYESEKLYRIAAYQKQIGDLDSAHRSLMKAVEGNPQWLPAKVELALVAIQLKKFEDALDLALQLQVERPELAEGHFLEGEVLIREKNLKGAERAYKRSHKIKPESTKILRLYQIYRASGRSEQALSLLEEWVTQYPGDQLVQNTLAGEMIRRGRNDDARKIYEELLARQPDDPSLLNNLAMLYQMAGDARALETAKKA